MAAKTARLLFAAPQPCWLHLQWLFDVWHRLTDAAFSLHCHVLTASTCVSSSLHCRAHLTALPCASHCIAMRISLRRHVQHLTALPCAALHCGARCSRRIIQKARLPGPDAGQTGSSLTRDSRRKSNRRSTGDLACLCLSLIVRCVRQRGSL